MPTLSPEKWCSRYTVEARAHASFTPSSFLRRILYSSSFIFIPGTGTPLLGPNVLGIRAGSFLQCIIAKKRAKKLTHGARQPRNRKRVDRSTCTWTVPSKNNDVETNRCTPRSLPSCTHSRQHQHSPLLPPRPRPPCSLCVPHFESPLPLPPDTRNITNCCCRSRCY